MRELISPVAVCLLLGAVLASVSRSKLITVFTQEREKAAAYRRGVLFYTWIVGGARSFLFAVGFITIALIIGSPDWPLAGAAAGGYLIAWSVISVQAYLSVNASNAS